MKPLLQVLIHTLLLNVGYVKSQSVSDSSFDVRRSCAEAEDLKEGEIFEFSNSGKHFYTKCDYVVNFPDGYSGHIKCENVKRVSISFPEGDEQKTEKSDFEYTFPSDTRTTTISLSGGYAPLKFATYTCSVSGVDINECETNAHDCDDNASCTNTVGSFTCACNGGWEDTEEDSAGKSCKDINECEEETDNCLAEAKCDNLIGNFFTCTCPSGFEGDAVTSCDDVNECETDEHDCDDNASCTNEEGSFTCACNSGWENTATDSAGKSCKDVNECLLAEMNNCDDNASCHNEDGTYSCSCKSGYVDQDDTSDPGTNCIDFNECDANEYECDAQATCVNDVPGYSCICKEGYEGDGKTCTDVNECDVHNGGCHIHATCTNVPGSYECACNAGFEGTGDICSDINECTVGHDCDDNAACDNEDGGFVCTCKEGFVGTGKQDECWRTIDTCHQGATCKTSSTAFDCTCDNGHYDGTVCTNIDKCAEELFPCTRQNEECSINSSGNYICVCKGGFNPNADGDCV